MSTILVALGSWLVLMGIAVGIGWFGWRSDPEHPDEDYWPKRGDRW